MQQQLVSIIIPAHNAGQYIAETITAAIEQTWPYKEIIVINDGSTDYTQRVIDGFGNAVINITLPQNKGASAARNAGLAIARGQYIQFLDADDLLSADKIESQMVLLSGSDDQLSHCRTIHFFDGTDHLAAHDDNSWTYADFNDPLDFLIKLYAGSEIMPGYGGMVNPHAWLSPRSLIDKAGPWNENLSVDDDGEFFCRVVLASKGIKFSHTGQVYYRKFTHGQSLSGQTTLKALKSSILATDLKYQHLTARFSDPIINRIFARHYWWLGVDAYPKFKQLSNQCTSTAKKLGYSGTKYNGGPAGHFIAKLLGWKIARIFAYYQQLYNKRNHL